MVRIVKNNNKGICAQHIFDGNWCQVLNSLSGRVSFNEIEWECTLPYLNAPSRPLFGLLKQHYNFTTNILKNYYGIPALEISLNSWTIWLFFKYWPNPFRCCLLWPQTSSRNRLSDSQIEVSHSLFLFIFRTLLNTMTNKV